MAPDSQIVAEAQRPLPATSDAGLQHHPVTSTVAGFELLMYRT